MLFATCFQLLSEVVLNTSWLDLGPRVGVILGAFSMLFRLKLRCYLEAVCASFFDRFLVDVGPSGTSKNIKKL